MWCYGWPFTDNFYLQCILTFREKKCKSKSVDGLVSLLKEACFFQWSINASIIPPWVIRGGFTEPRLFDGWIRRASSTGDGNMWEMSRIVTFPTHIPAWTEYVPFWLLGICFRVVTSVGGNIILARLESGIGNRGSHILWKRGFSYGKTNPVLSCW